MNGFPALFRKTPMLLVLLPMAYALLRWLTQPPVGWGWLSFVALVPLLMFDCFGAESDLEQEDPDQEEPPRSLDRPKRRQASDVWVWLAAFGFWLVSLQGIRHAHPALVLGWIALAGYLAIYSVMFLVSLRQLQRHRVPLYLAVPIAWVGWEWIRNHLLSGISVCMLGHGLADQPRLIQIADLGGTYLVSVLVALVNAGIWEAIRALVARQTTSPSDVNRQTTTAVQPVIVASVALALTLIYGHVRLGHARSELGTRFALLGLDEQTEYDQDPKREEQIFLAYRSKSIELMKQPGPTLDAIVWPESMHSGGLAWMEALPDLIVPPDLGMSLEEYRWSIDQYRSAFRRRASDFQDMLRGARVPSETSGEVPHLLVGGPVLTYGARSNMHSGLVHITPELDISWYGKNHLVMFGEYIPILSTWSVLRPWVPQGMGLAAGKGPHVFEVKNANVMGSVCIETAVERVAVNQLSRLRQEGSSEPDVILNISNDAWFDHSSVVEHHLRSAQLLAVGCRKPILCAGNGGPTAWIDSLGRVVERVAQGEAGHVIATPLKDGRKSLYVLLGSWPYGIAAGCLVGLWVLDRRQRRKVRPSHASTGRGRKRKSDRRSVS